MGGTLVVCPSHKRPFKYSLKTLANAPSPKATTEVKEEKGVPESHNYMLPCFTSDSQPPNNFDSLAVLRYFQKIRTFRNDTIIIEITEQLKKLKFQNTREIHVSVPKGAFEHKCFILAIFKQFSKCMELMSKALNSEAQKGT
ncbi:interleukin-31 [Tamandua tetradactyla]|uniref:interleukin-31 n=1 Tax=Tamandua tetradactyla TaxID=48850 RepID=UPI0040538B68